MSTWFPVVPGPPTWSVDWKQLDDTFEWVRALRGCPQDPVYHAEGDVWIHTRMVCESLADLPAYRALSEADRAITFVAALMHDIAKPERTQVQPDGSIGAPGHSRRGAILARRLLWQLNVPFSDREQVCALIRFHQVPFFAIERESPFRAVIEVSQTARCDLLALVAEVDARGRKCADQERLLTNTALFAELCRENGCLTTPFAFPSDVARFLYFRRPDRDPTYAAYDDTRGEVFLLSGLPGVGKDRWIAKHAPALPVVSLDAIRADLHLDPDGDQGAVIQAAREAARRHLRAGQSYIWNATNVSRDQRQRAISLFADYRARIRIIYLEVSDSELHQQNRDRPRPVPTNVIERLLDRWEVPDRTEAHKVEYHMQFRNA
jgi:predicted kinase